MPMLTCDECLHEHVSGNKLCRQQRILLPKMCTCCGSVCSIQRSGRTAKNITQQLLTKGSAKLVHALTLAPAWILGLKAFGLRSKIASTADCRVLSFSMLLQQLTQLQPSQYRPDAKHSQYLWAFIFAFCYAVLCCAGC